MSKRFQWVVGGGLVVGILLLALGAGTIDNTVYAPNLLVYTNASIRGTATIGVATVTNALTLQSATASTLASFNASKVAGSVANGTGLLRNNGSGSFTWDNNPASGANWVADGSGSDLNGAAAMKSAAVTNALTAGTLGVSGATVLHDATVTNGVTAGSVTVVTNLSVAGTATMSSATVSNLLSAGSLSVATNATVGGTEFVNYVVATNGVAGDATGFINIITDRHYDAVVPVTTTITAAIGSITDSSVSKRYCVYVPNGTYAETVDMTSVTWVDVIGQSRTGVVVTSSSQVTDTFKIGGRNVMLAHMTILHTNAFGDTPQYPIHADTSLTPANDLAATEIVYDCTVTAQGAGAKSGIGIGLHPNERIILANCDFTSSNNAGVYIHNWTSGAASAPSEAYVVNCTGVSTAASPNGNGLWYYNYGTAQPDVLSVVGGNFTGPDHGFFVTNIVAGAGETRVFISPTTTYSSLSTVGTVTFATWLPSSMTQVPRLRGYTGNINTGPNGTTITDGVTPSTATGNWVFNGQLNVGVATNAQFGARIFRTVNSTQDGTLLVQTTQPNSGDQPSYGILSRNYLTQVNQTNSFSASAINGQLQNLSTGTNGGGYSITAFTYGGGFRQSSTTIPVTYAYGADLVETVDANCATVTNLKGIASEATIGSGSTVNNLRHFEVVDATGSGTLTTQYGFYAPAMSKGASIWGLYLIGGSNYLGGRLGLGTTTPQEQLEVAGNIRVSGTANSIQGGHTNVIATSGTPQTLFYISVPNTNSLSGDIIWKLFATDGTDTQSQVGHTLFDSVAKSTTVTAGVTSITNAAVCSGGTTLSGGLTANVATNNVLAIQATLTTSLTTTNMLIKWRIQTPSVYSVTAL